MDSFLASPREIIGRPRLALRVSPDPLGAWQAGCEIAKWPRVQRALAPGTATGLLGAMTSASAAAAVPAATAVALIEQAAARFSGRPSWDDYFMATAVLLSTRSPCERLHVGCVLVSGGTRKHRIIAAGYNGFLPGTPHVSRLRDGHEQATVHAEQNAVSDAARRGSPLDGAVAYVTHFPCINCAKIFAAAGIAEVRYRHDYKNDPLVAPLLADGGIRIVRL